MKYEIIDNFLNVEEFNTIKNIVSSKDFYWCFHENVANADDNDDAYYFTHTFYDYSNVRSGLYNRLIIPILEKLDVCAILRAKANLYPNIGQLIENANHVDYPFEHKGAILYLNTNNGYTILEDGTKIESVENRLLKFEPHKKHRSTHCTDLKRRMNINLNYF
jgi:hypothetical protein